MSKLIASVFGIGYIKGGGTVAAAVTCLVIYFLWPLAIMQHTFSLLIVTVIVSLVGVVVGNLVEPHWGKDSSRVVIDEVAGMLVTLLFIPPNVYYLLIGLVLFRFFDIVKPLYIRRMEALPGGTGVMMDDILAGVYANIVLQVIVYFFKF